MLQHMIDHINSDDLTANFDVCGCMSVDIHLLGLSLPHISQVSQSILGILAEW